MRIESLDCNNCGAPVEVPENVQFMRCGHCGSRLKVHRETSAHYTEVLGQIEESTRELKGEVRALRLQNEIRDLDDTWRVKREGLMVRGKDGSASKPSAVGGVVGGIAMVVFGIFWIAVTASATSQLPSRSSSSFRPGPPFRQGMFQEPQPAFELVSLFPLFGVFFVVAAIIMAALAVSKASEYNRAEGEYVEKRRRLEERMGRERGGDEVALTSDR